MQRISREYLKTSYFTENNACFWEKCFESARKIPPIVPTEKVTISLKFLLMSQNGLTRTPFQSWLVGKATIVNCTPVIRDFWSICDRGGISFLQLCEWSWAYTGQPHILESAKQNCLEVKVAQLLSFCLSSSLNYFLSLITIIISITCSPPGMALF